MKTSPQVLVTVPIFPEVLDPLDEFGLTIWEGEQPIPRQQLLDLVSDKVGLLSILSDRVNQELLDHSPQLRVVSQMAVGVDNIDRDACRTRRVRIGHTPDVLTETTADTAWALLSAVVRRLPEGERAVKNGQWGPWQPDWMLGGDLWGTTLGIVGMGRIGAAIARRGAGFGMKILYTGPNRKPGIEQALSVEFRALEELLTNSDHVILSAPHTPQTQHLINAHTLRLMKPDATLINIARGALVNQDDLYTALAQGVIGRAGLDVSTPEPLPPDHRLLELPNCLVIPHLGSASYRTRRAMADLAVKNLVAGLSDQTMPAELK